MNTSPTRLIPLLCPGPSSSDTLARCSLALLLAVLGWFSFAGRAAGQGLVPERLSFQGYMEDGTGTPLGLSSPTNYLVVFRIYNSSSGGASLWAERQTVTFDRGNYSVIMGQGSAVPPEPSPLLSATVISASGTELYVESTVTINGTDARILPRLRLLPTPYAFMSVRATTAASADQALNVNGSAIAAGSIQQDRLGALVISNILQAPIPDSRLSANIISGAIPDSRLSANVLNGAIADSRLSANVLSGAIADSRLSANIAHRNTANTFTGDQAISGNASVSGNLTVNNNLNLGSIGQFKVAAGEESLRIVRGQVQLTPRVASPTGAVPIVGTGFTVRRIPNYTVAGSTSPLSVAFEITFTTPFSGIPTVTVNPVRDFNSGGYALSSGYQELWGYGRVEEASATKAVVAFAVPGANSLDVPFAFIAVGPR